MVLLNATFSKGHKGNKGNKNIETKSKSENIKRGQLNLNKNNFTFLLNIFIAFVDNSSS
jgi:hypothetical protein